MLPFSLNDLTSSEADTSVCKPLLLCFSWSELNNITKSFQNCGWLAKAAVALNILLSLKFTKLTADIVWSIADLMLKNIIEPTAPLIQLTIKLVSLSLLITLLPPFSIRYNIFSKASLYLVPYKASILFILSGLNITSLLLIHSDKNCFLPTLFTVSDKSLAILPTTQFCPGCV